MRAAYDPEPNMGRESKRRVQAARERSQADGRRVKSKDGLAAVPPAVIENWELSDALEGQDDQQGQGDQENQLSAQGKFTSFTRTSRPGAPRRRSGTGVQLCGRPPYARQDRRALSMPQPGG